MQLVLTRDRQQEAARLLFEQIEQGGEITIDMPIGYGRTIILVEAARMVNKPVAFMSRISEMREQTAHIAERMNVSNIVSVRPTEDVSQYYAVILSQELMRFTLDHPIVVRQR